MTVKPETLMEQYIELRDKRSALSAKFKEKDDALKEGMEKIENWLHKRMLDAGTDTLKNDAGTAYIQVQIKPSAADWTVVWKWMIDNERPDLLEKRLSSKAVREYKEEHGEYPPGLNILEEQKVIIRRS